MRNELIVVKYKVVKIKIEMLCSLGEELIIWERLVDVEKNVAERRVVIDACEREIVCNVEVIENNILKMDVFNKIFEKLWDVLFEYVGLFEV